jgi:PAS domain S-box-containing protein
MLFVFDLDDRRTIYANRQSLAAVGFSPEGILRKAVDGDSDLDVHAADRAPLRGLLGRLDAAEAGEAVEYRYRIRRADGAWRWLWHRLVVFRRHPDGRLWQILGVAEDVTESREAEERVRLLESVVVNAHDAVFVTDAGEESSPRILYVNPAFCAMTGYAPDEVLGQTPEILYGPRSEPIAIEKLRSARAAGEPVVAWLTNYRKDGTPFSVEESVAPVRDGDGRTTHWIAVLRDVTERKRAEAERAEMERKLGETQKLESLGVLAGGIAHDFNNLLTGILGNAALARQTGASAGADPFLEQIEAASLRAADLCKQMLAYAGKGRIDLERLDLSRLVRETTPLLHLSVARKAELVLDLADDLPRVRADATQMRQIVMNLVLNAAEAVGDRPGRIVVSTRRVFVDRDRLDQSALGQDLPEGDYVLVQVADDGEGMAPETLARIFEPFYTTKFTGRGLGLSAVLGIVRAHAGTLQVSSELGRGTVFRLYFPPLELPAEPPGREPAAVPAPWQGDGGVLVIDDEEPVRTVMRRMLEAAGFRVAVAADGLEGVEQLRAANGDLRLVLLDLTMPNLSGEEAFDRIRGVRADVLVVVMSGCAEDEVRARFAGRDPDGFLQKPFRPSDLIAVVRDALAAVRPPTGPA